MIKSVYESNDNRAVDKLFVIVGSCSIQKDFAVYGLIFDRVKADSVNFYLADTNSAK